MTTSESTRNDAYYSLENLSASRRAVYDVIERLGPITDAQIAKALGWGINRVTGRRNELVSIGRVVEAGTELSAFGRRVVTWKLAEVVMDGQYALRF